MQKIDERSLELKAEDYFDYCQNRKIRGLWVITDKQSIFYSQVLKDDYRTHDEIEIDIENEIHPNEQKFGWDAIRSSHAYIASAGVELIISMPDNGKLSYSQAKFIIDTLNIVEKFNSNEDNKKIKIDLFEPSDKESKYNITSIDGIKLLKDKIQKEITHNIDIEDEKIIGTTLPKEEVINNIMSNLNLNSYRSVNDLKILLRKCSSYINDDYYSNVFKEVMPNYKNIEKLYNIIIDLDIQNEQVESFTLENLEDVLYKLIKQSFNNKRTFDDILDYLHKLQYQDRTLVNELFPNYELLLKLCEDIIYIDKKELNKELESTTSYEDVVKVITKFNYSKNKKELLEKYEELNKYNNNLEDLKQAKNIIDSKEYLNGLINNRKEKLETKNSYILSLEENKREIVKEEVSQENINNLIRKSSSNFLKRILFRNRIKKYENELEKSKDKIETLSKDNRIKEAKINNLDDEINYIETEFKEFTKFDYMPDNTNDMNLYYQKDLDEYESNILYLISSLKKDIYTINNNLEEIDESNILEDIKEVENIQKSMKEDTENIVTSESDVIQESPKSITNSK